MKQFRALLWKEWREDHLYLWIGLGVLLILPLINAWEEVSYFRRFELHTTDWISLLGGIFAIVVSVGVSCPDLSDPLEDFWRSRPVAIGRWMLTKYGAGLLIVLLCCIVPAAIELLLSKTTDAAPFIVWYPFLWTAIFSIGFLVGCLLRKSAQTSLVAIGAMLLLYFLPVVLPPLRWLNVAAVPSPPASTYAPVVESHKLHPWAYVWTKPPLRFATGMIALTVLCTLLALVAVKRDWRISVGRKTIFGSVAAAFLLLLATTAFQLGTNMPVLQTVRIPESAWFSTLYAGDDRATFRAGQTSRPDPNRDYGTTPAGVYQDVTADAAGMHLSPMYVWNEQYAIDGAPASPVQPNIRYLTDFAPNWGKYMLRVVDTSNGTESRLPLQDMVIAKNDLVTSWQERPKIFHNQLYVPGNELFVLDISRPQSPKIISKTPYSHPRWASGGDREALTLFVPPAPGLSDAEQLELAGVQIDNGLYLNANSEAGGWLILYRLQSLSQTEARFVYVAGRGPTGLESLLKNYRYMSVIMKAGKIYATRYGGSAINDSVTVYAATGPHPLEPIGHFGAPSIIGMCPLSDGRCIVAGRDENHWPAAKLWLLGPPPQHRQ